jgi:hypothetical protein
LKNEKRKAKRAYERKRKERISIKKSHAEIKEMVI